MHSSSSELGLVEVLVEELGQHILPRALELKEKVDQRESLDEYDTAFLEHALEVAAKTDEVMKRHAEYQALAARVSHLYHEITAKALENAKQP